MRHIYDLLFTIKYDKGTGIGLWLTKNIVERLKGKIEVSSSTQPGQSERRSRSCFRREIFLSK